MLCLYTALFAILLSLPAASETVPLERQHGTYTISVRGGGTWMEMVVPIARKRMHRSRAVDHEGEILDISAHYHSLIADSLYEEA